MKRTLMALVALTVAVGPVFAQPQGGRRPQKAQNAEKAAPEKADEPEKKAPELKVTPGLVGVSHHEKDWYFDVPDTLLGRRILTVTRFVSNTPGASEYGGELVTGNMIYWEKASNGNLLLRVDALTIQADPDDDIAKAVKVSSENPILASLKPEKASAPGCTRVKVTALFEGDNPAFSLTNRTKKAYNSLSYKVCSSIF